MLFFRLTIVSLLVGFISTLVLAGEYEFEGKKFKLQKFENLPPKAVNKNLSLFLVNYPSELSLQEFQSPVKSQSERGACAYFSSIALAESLVKKKTGKVINMSEEYLIYYGKAVLGEFSNGDGSRASLNLKALSKGFFLEKDMPYGPSWFAKGLPCENYKDEQEGTPVMCYAHVGPGDEIKDRLIEFTDFTVEIVPADSASIINKMNEKKNAVVIGLPLHPEGWNGETGECDFNEEYRKRCEVEPDAQCGGHSILLTGYNMKERKFYFKNSWGTSWGKLGYGSLSFDYVDKYSSTGTVTADYSGPVVIPPDHDQIATPASEAVSVVIDQSSDIKVKMTGVFKNLLNRVLYTSTFIAFKKDQQLPIDDANADIMSVPENLKPEYGSYVRGADYILKNGVDTIVVDDSEPAVMDIPSLIINKDPSVSEYFLRISAYIHDDIEGWNPVYRIYSPIEL
ncbi:MAG: hypothetical protein A2381_09230 [Bdellovibrionales bacterium RIFOXYB1_FULL_37_110]|nr:MAG: hypothetical protein A2181_05995 [Bdellovibrionales bacterium RIFOXYA1_FULL_38_20]OFZ49265.1 MAG: hypothetical protein A2417_17170 [Bdellovibrionales bacterium RIFOXYC1_FULL_37_79]OFZ58272.1 MAG: hypothetical protein A2381_09230 [Bdellovibrionales bacterium RIFOXYB1_FULL_37_110]OFZ61526.1 MAG: hypothetical protein A2577_00450 [Bdellovibrionales bacterium RIFOXYD1_FULL_36_51]